MKEFTFIRNNIDKWQRAEIIISDADSQSPDRLAEVYTDLRPTWLLRRRIIPIPASPSI